MLKRSSLPLRPRPAMNESIVGFLHRLFSLHGHRTPSWLGKALCTHPPQPERDHILGQFFDLPGDAAWLSAQHTLRLAIPEPWQRSSTLSLRLCHRCLTEQGYHKWYWDLPLVTACPRHNIPLRERCHCGRTLRWRTLDLDWHCICRRNLLNDDTEESTALNCRLSEVIIHRAQQHPERLSTLLAWLHFACQLVNQLQQSRKRQRGPHQHQDVLSQPLPQLRKWVAQSIRAAYAQPGSAFIYLRSDSKPLAIMRWISRHDLGHAKLMARYLKPLLHYPTPLSHDRIALNPAIPVQEYELRLNRLWCQWQKRPRLHDLPPSPLPSMNGIQSYDYLRIRLRLMLLNQWLNDGIQPALPLLTSFPDLPGNDCPPATLVRELDCWLGQLRQASLSQLASQVFATAAKESYHVALPSCYQPTVSQSSPENPANPSTNSCTPEPR